MIYTYQLNKRTKTIVEGKNKGKSTWIHAVSPTEDEEQALKKTYKLDEDLLKDGLDMNEMPRLEQEEGKTYIYLSAPTERLKYEHTSSFLIVLTKKHCVTITKNQLELFSRLLGGKKKVNSFSPKENLLSLLHILSRLFEERVRRIIKQTNTNKTDLSNLTNKDIVRLIEHEDVLNSYITSFGATIATYNRILRSKCISFTEEDEEDLEDLIIDLNETLALCKQTLKTISNMRTYYSTKLSNDLNNTVKVLTLFTVFLSIPTLIASVYGMNIALPYQDNTNLFFLLLAGAIGIEILLVSILKKLHLL